MNKTQLERTTKWIYEAARIEAIASGRRIVPEPWDERDDAFRNQMTEYIGTLENKIDSLPTPKEAHDSWWRKYEEMGWVYGEVRDPIAKIHPDMVPYEELPEDEREKDEVFLELVKIGLRFILPKEK